MPDPKLNYSASLLLTGPDGGEVRRLLAMRVAYEPAVLERDRIKVNRSPVNEDHNSELAMSARHAGTVALQLLFRELNRNDPVARLWFDIEPPSMAVTGRSAELLFGLMTYLWLGKGDIPVGIPNCDFMATGTLDRDGNVGSVEEVATKIRAALATQPKENTKLFYPRADEGQIDDSLRIQCRDNGITLCPVNRIDEALDSLGVPLLGSWPRDISPFRSLQAFDTSFSRVFFGRQREVAALTALLDARAASGRPGALIIGASGAGKSSFCLAGVLPALAKAQPGLEYAVWRPRDAASGRGEEPAGVYDVTASIIAQWQVRDENQTGFSLARPATDITNLDQLPDCLATGGRCRIFVVDQFEELFTLPFAREARIAFARFLQSLQARGVWVIGTLRSEFYPQYLELADEDAAPVLTPMFEGDGQYNLPRMSKDSLDQVIKRPAELAGLWFEQRSDGVALSQSLLADAMATEDALPLLGFALQTLYDEAEHPEASDDRDAANPRTLTFAAYNRLDGLSGAIGVVAAQAFDSVDQDAKVELPALLSALAVPSLDGSRESARPASIDQWPFGSAGRRLINELTNIGVLVSEEGVTPNAPALVRVAHEALFSHWDVAAKLLSDSRQSRLLIEDFRQRAKLWDAEAQPRGRLLSNKLDIENGRVVRPLVPNTAGNGKLMAFIDASVSRARRQRNIWYSSAAATALVLAGTTGWALVERDKAEASQRIAESNALKAGKAAEAARIAETDAKNQTEIANTARLNANEAARAERVAAQRALAAATAERQQRAEATRQRDLAFAATRVAKQQTNVAQAQTLEARRQRSRAVAQLAEQAIESGDAMTGILLARSQLQLGDEANWTGAAQSALLRGMLENREIFSLPGNGAPIVAATFSPDGSHLAAADDRGTGLIWDLEAQTEKPIALLSNILLGKELIGVDRLTFSPDGRKVSMTQMGFPSSIFELNGDQTTSIELEGEINSAAFSPDSKRILTGSQGGDLRVWTLSDPQVVWADLDKHDESVESVAFSSDGNKMLTASDDGTARIWTYERDAVKWIELKGHKSSINAAAFSPDGKKVVTASEDGTARVWTFENGHANFVELSGHAKALTSAAFSPDGTYIVTGSHDKTARVWSVYGDRVHLEPLSGHEGSVLSVQFSPDSEQILTTSSDLTARIWSLAGKDVTSVILRGHGHGTTSAQFSPDGKRLVTTSYDGTARIFNLNGILSNLAFQPRFEEEVYNSSLSPDGRHVVMITRAGDARVQLVGGDITSTVWLTGFNSRVTSAKFSTKGLRIVTGHDDGTVRIWSLSGDRASSIELPKHEESIISVSFSPKGDQIISTSFDKVARISTQKENKFTWLDITETAATFNSAEFSPDGSRIMFTYRQDSELTKNPYALWSLNELRAAPIFLFKDRTIEKSAFSPNGRLVATASDGSEYSIDVWALGELKSPPIRLTGHRGRITGISFASDNSKLVTMSADRSVRVWTLDGYQSSSVELAGHNHEILKVALSPNGRHVATVSSDGTKIWTIDGDQVSSIKLTDPSSVIISADFDQNSDSIVTVTEKGVVRRWPIPFGKELYDWSTSILTRCLTRDQLASAGIDGPEPPERPPCV